MKKRQMRQTEGNSTQMEGTGNAKGRERGGRKTPPLPIILVLAVFVVLAFYLVVKLHPKPDVPVQTQERGFLDLQPENAASAESGNMPYMGDILDYFICGEDTGGEDYYCYALFIFFDGTIYSGECGRETRSEFFQRRWGDHAEKGEILPNHFVNWTYRGKLYEEDLQVLVEEQTMAWDNQEMYNRHMDTGYSIPNASDRSRTKGDTNGRIFFSEYSVCDINGNQYFYGRTYCADSEYVTFLRYSEHSWFAINAIRDSAFYREWMQECFGDDWQIVNEVEYDYVQHKLEKILEQYREYYEARLQELGY